MKTLYFNLKTKSPQSEESNIVDIITTINMQKEMKDFGSYYTRISFETFHEIELWFRKQIGVVALKTGINILDLLKTPTNTCLKNCELIKESLYGRPNVLEECTNFLEEFKKLTTTKYNFIDLNNREIWSGDKFSYCAQDFIPNIKYFKPHVRVSIRAFDYELENTCMPGTSGSYCVPVKANGTNFHIFNTPEHMLIPGKDSSVSLCEQYQYITNEYIVIEEEKYHNKKIDRDSKITKITIKYATGIGDRSPYLGQQRYEMYISATSYESDTELIDAYNNLLNAHEPVVPVNPKTYLCRAKFVNYPTSIKLPISIPVDLYDGDKVVKSIELTKSTEELYSGRTDLPDNKTYTAKVNTSKMDKNFLSRTKITFEVSPNKWSTDFTFTCTNTDPYPGGGSEPGGGSDGVMPNPGQNIDGVDLPLPPGISVTDTGLVTLYHPTLSQVKELARVLWKPNFFEKISKMFNNPMDALQGLVQLPIEVGTAGSQELVVGNVGTGINMNVCAKQYIFTTVGTIQVPQKYNSYLDFSPFTKGQIFLPFIGFRPLNIDEVMGDTITVTYQIDILSGACCATLLNSKGLMFANYSGNCATSIALSGRDFSNTIQSAITVATATGVALATGGAGAPALASAGMSAETASAVSAIGSAGSVAGAVAGSKPGVERSGSCSGSLSMLTTRTPYVLIERPNPCIPSSQNAIDGYPSFITKKLGECQGLTSVYSCNLELLTNATDTEKSEVLQLLKGGVKI